MHGGVQAQDAGERTWGAPHAVLIHTNFSARQRAQTCQSCCECASSLIRTSLQLRRGPASAASLTADAQAARFEAGGDAGRLSYGCQGRF